MTTYAFGYGEWATRLSRVELEGRVTVFRLDAEFRRRAFALMDAAQAAGTDLGIGGGWRSSATQEATFRQRYYVVPCPGGVVRWDGNRDGVVECWQKRDGVASAAPPGRSYHEETTPEGKALAIDFIGDLVWMNARCAAFGIKHFADVNDEPWHGQPVEVPNSRSRYDPAVHVLGRWLLPGDVPDVTPAPAPTPDQEDDDMARVLIRDARFHDVFQTSPCVAPVDDDLGEPVRVIRHLRTIRSLARMCEVDTLSATDVSTDDWRSPGNWKPVPVSTIPDLPA
jgi:hypothetical protein